MSRVRSVIKLMLPVEEGQRVTVVVERRIQARTILGGRVCASGVENAAVESKLQAPPRHLVTTSLQQPPFTTRKSNSSKAFAG